MAEYPEHEKLKKIADQSQAIGEFLDWLRGNLRVHLMVYGSHEIQRECHAPCHYIYRKGTVAAAREAMLEEMDLFAEPDPNRYVAEIEDCDACEGTGTITEFREELRDFHPHNIQDILALYFEIDQDVLEDEKRSMLRSLQEDRGETPSPSAAPWKQKKKAPAKKAAAKKKPARRSA